jgi:hypothetical protein
MKDSPRRAVAFIAAKLIGKRSGSSIYDYAAGGYTHFSGNVGPDIAIYDHSASSHISGSPQQFFHYGTSAHISFSITGRNFSGYDYGSGSHFSGSVSQSNVTLYDYGESKYFQYLLS